MPYVCIRGAVTAKVNEREEILEKTEYMLRSILEANQIQTADVISIAFTMTKDLDQVYPAVAARSLGLTHTALLCYQEMEIVGSLRKCIRVMLTCESSKKQTDVTHIYLEGAACLRPDLEKEKTKHLAIAVDGPAGSGKSTVAKEISKRLKLTYIDTGAMYRAVGLFCLRNQIDTKNEQAVSAVVQEVSIRIEAGEGGQKIYLSEEDVTDLIRSQQAGAAASDVAVVAAVRKRLVALQRELADKASVIMDGRDIGTNVLPDAPVKIYLQASVEERTKRRLNELMHLGKKTDFETVKREIEQRDTNDSNRAINPLRKAVDAVELDTSNMTLEEVVAAVLNIISLHSK